MDLPLISKIGFLDRMGNAIAGPGEWMEAQVEVRLSPQEWERVRLVRQTTEELPLSLSRLKGRTRVLARWPRSDTGHYRLTLLFDEMVIEEQIITIQPGKISPAAYRQLLEDLEIHLPASIVLGLQRNAAFGGIKILPPGESTLAMELARLSRAINGNAERMGLAQVLNELATNPHKILATTELWVPRERARRPHPSGLTQAMSRPYNLDKHGIPIRLLDTRVEHSVDVYENRLVKAYVRQVSLRLRRLNRLLENESAYELSEEVQKLLALLDAAKRNALFLENVALPSSLLTQSTMVLLKRPAYHAALQGYLELHKSPGAYIAEPALERPLENLPFLYQVWGTLKVLRVLLEVAGASGYEVQSQRLAERDVYGIFVRLLPDGKPALVLKHPTTGTVIKAIPERTYAKHGQIQSISFSQRPDIAIEIFPQQGFPHVYLFDPKYKLRSEDQENGKPKKEDIDKMHTYRDALRDSEQRQVVQYAAILYPGPTQNYGHGIEALQAIPGSEVSLEKRLEAILLRALQI